MWQIFYPCEWCKYLLIAKKLISALRRFETAPFTHSPIYKQLCQPKHFVDLVKIVIIIIIIIIIIIFYKKPNPEYFIVH